MPTTVLIFVECRKNVWEKHFSATTGLIIYLNDPTSISRLSGEFFI